MRNAERGIEKGEFGMRSAECGVRNAERVTRLRVQGTRQREKQSKKTYFLLAPCALRLMPYACFILVHLE